MPDPSPREQLAALVRNNSHPVAGEVRSSNEVATAILAAGWRPPAQVIEDPAELEALPAGSIVIELDEDTDPDPYPPVWLRIDDDDCLAWVAFANPQLWDSSHISLPVRVVHFPTPIGDTE